MKYRSKARNILIVNGYFRRNHPYPIAVDIIRICQLFFTELYRISFDAKKLHHLGVLHSEQEINIRGFTFTWTICDDGDEQYDVFLVCKKPQNFVGIAQCDFYLESMISFDEYKNNTVRYGRVAKGVYSPWVDDNSRIEINQIDQELIYGHIDNNKEGVVTEINITLYFDILYLKYDDQSKEAQVFKEVKLNKDIHYVWDIDDILMNEFANSAKHEVFYSDNFGFNEYNNEPLKQYGFHLKLMHHKIDGKGNFLLHRLCLPNNVKKMEFSYTLRCGNKIASEKTNPYINHLVGIEISLKDKFEVWIEITEIVGIDGNKIPQNDWFKYGIGV